MAARLSRSVESQLLNNNVKVPRGLVVVIVTLALAGVAVHPWPKISETMRAARSWRIKPAKYRALAKKYPGDWRRLPRNRARFLTEEEMAVLHQARWRFREQPEEQRVIDKLMTDLRPRG